MGKPNSIIFLLHIFKQSAKENTALWVCKNFWTLHGWGAGKLGKILAWHDNPISVEDIG